MKKTHTEVNFTIGLRRVNSFGILIVVERNRCELQQHGGEQGTVRTARALRLSSVVISNCHVKTSRRMTHAASFFSQGAICVRRFQIKSSQCAAPAAFILVLSIFNNPILIPCGLTVIITTPAAGGHFYEMQVCLSTWRRFGFEEGLMIFFNVSTGKTFVICSFGKVYLPKPADL